MDVHNYRARPRPPVTKAYDFVVVAAVAGNGVGVVGLRDWDAGVALPRPRGVGEHGSSECGTMGNTVAASSRGSEIVEEFL